MKTLRPPGHDSQQPTSIERAKRLIEPLVVRPKTIRCPTEGHEDRHPSTTLYPDGFRCWSCGAFGDSLDYYALNHGLTIREALRSLGVLDEGRVLPKRQPHPDPVRIPSSVAEVLVSSAEFALLWEASKLLAMKEPGEQRGHILRNWDALNERGIDIPVLWSLASLVRGVALFRYANPAKAHEATERNRAVRRLLAEIEEARP